MKNLYKNSALTFLLLAGVCAILSGFSCTAHSSDIFEEQLKKSFRVKQGQLFFLKSDFGSVKVDSWDRDNVHIVITKKAKTFSQREANALFEDVDVMFDQSSSGIKVIVKCPPKKNWFFNNNKLKLHFDITVPRVFDLDINTAGGGITIGETKGSVDAETSGGSISLDGVDGNTRVHTSGGSLNLKNVKGNISGSTSGGSIYAEIIEQVNDDCSLKTSGGSITLYLPRHISAIIDAQTSGGRVVTDFPVTVQGKIKSSKLYGEINNGGPLIKLRTSGCSIRIKKLSDYLIKSE